jgi:hypothetical protein
LRAVRSGVAQVGPLFRVQTRTPRSTLPGRFRSRAGPSLFDLQASASTFRAGFSPCYNAAMRKQLLGLPIALLSVACGGGDRYALVSGGENSVYRLDKQTGEVILVKGDNSWRVLSPAAEDIAQTDLRNVHVLGLEGPDAEELLYVRLYNGTAIEFSEITFSVHSHEEAVLYRTPVNLRPFEAANVSFTIIRRDTPPGQAVIVSAKGIRRET